MLRRNVARSFGQSHLALGMVVLLLLSLLTGTATAKPGGRPGTKGSYTLLFTGEFKGTGTAKVNPVHVSIDADLTGITGPGGSLSIKNLRLEDGRFEGTGTLGGQPVRVNGRVDAAEGGVVTTARLLVTVVTADNRVARGVGQQTVKDD